MVIDSPIDVISRDQAVQRIHRWAVNRVSAVVCICNVHSVVTARLDPEFSAVLRRADMNTPDGAPIAWTLRAHGHPRQARIDGPGLMWGYCELAALTGQSIYLYGSTRVTLDILINRLVHAFPHIVIAGSYAPPFRPLTESEDAEIVAEINASGASVVWVGLGCPKQEFWIDNHKDRITAVMIGVGAAFDYHAEIVKRAPNWMRRAGLEWLHRLASEPRRLFKRYAVTNSLFLWYSICQELTFLSKRTF
ncbi:glycosyltransferase [Sphingomonas koreensis]|nr:glycosyltransferase [Sphingomonas koreensis]